MREMGMTRTELLARIQELAAERDAAIDARLTAEREIDTRVGERVANAMTAREAARVLGCSPSTVSAARVRAARREPTHAYCDACGCLRALSHTEHGPQRGSSC